MIDQSRKLGVTEKLMPRHNLVKRDLKTSLFLQSNLSGLLSRRRYA